jgi:hypothetical protein
MEVPRRNIVAHNRVDDQKQYCDMKITIKPRVEDMRNYTELTRTLFEEDHGYTYRVVVYVVKIAGKKLVIVHVKRRPLCSLCNVLVNRRSGFTSR